jgi:hypothetical protein
MSPFRNYVAALITQYGTARKLAEMIGMSESAFARGVTRGSLSEENLLLLAKAVGDPPVRVLRLAGKGRLADLMDEHAQPQALSREDRILIALPLEVKQQLVRIVQNLTAK